MVGATAASAIFHVALSAILAGGALVFLLGTSGVSTYYEYQRDRGVMERESDD